MRDTVREGYEAGDYEGKYGRNRNLNSFELEFFHELERGVPGKKALDLGCGTGVPYDRYLVSRGFTVTGVDFTPRHLSMARRNVPEVEFIEGDLTQMNFDDESFNAVLILYSLFHVPRAEHAGVFRNAARILSPGGMLLATLGTGDMEYSEEEGWANTPRMAWSSWPAEFYIEMLASNSFTLVRKEYEGNPGDEEYHLWVLCTKD